MEALPTTIVESNHIDIAIAVWLDSKFQRSRSLRTRDHYERTLYKFRSTLRSVGRDLDPDGNIIGTITEESRERACDEIAMVAQKFAGIAEKNGTISEATYNNRLAIISSFYDAAKKRHFFKAFNPIKSVERSKVQEYKHTQPLDVQDVALKLKKIDRSTKVGMRDYAMLAIFFQTGRRLAEVVNLEWKDTLVQGDIITLTFSCKGGKVMIDKLPPAVGKALLAWLAVGYGDVETLDPNAPLWFPLKSGAMRRDEQGLRVKLSMRSVSDICQRWLGFTKVHTTRHTWARQMENQGAKVSDIQERLGHESLATTGRYLMALKRGENPHAQGIADAFGLGEE